MNLLKACQYFRSILKFADYTINRKFQYAYAAYKKHFEMDLIPGPAGTKGQVFFVESNPNLVVKFTHDSAEARNMMLIWKIQSGMFIPPDFSSEELAVIKNQVIRVYNVFGFEFDRGKVYIIEQEKGMDVPFDLATKMLRHIGERIAIQPDEYFKVLQDNLSEPERLDELSKTMVEALIRKGKITIEQEQDVNVGDLGKLLKVVREKIDSSFKDFRPSNMVITKHQNKYIVKLIDIGQGTGAKIDIPTIKA